MSTPVPVSLLILTAAIGAAGFTAVDQTPRPAASSPASTPGRPDESRFTPVVAVPPGELDEPMAFDVAPDGKVFIVERKGVLKVHDPATKSTAVVAEIPVNTKYTNAAGVQREAEEGLVGVTLDPGFGENGWIYMVYAEPAVMKHVLARWEYKDGQLTDGSKKVVLEWSVQREECCHTGGGMAWDAQGNLYLTVGNNTSNSIGAQTDERPGRSSWDDQRGAANTNDLRGKILRIHPEPDGTYTIPKGNLFPPGTAGTRPEIFSMGHRNAWRVSIDSRTGYVYWGEVGPDANEDSEVGPRGYDELNQAKGPGFFGWPYFIGNNFPYPYYDYVKGAPAAPKDAAKPTNTSANNTGLRVLPPAQPAFIYYPYGSSEQFPEVGSGGRSATGGPIYRRADRPKAARPFPDYYEGKWLAADLSRGWIMAISIDDRGNYAGMERFVPQYRPSEIIDLKFGPDGDLYVLDYGSTWFAKSDDSQLVRIEYNGGNRPPLPRITTDRSGGIAPFSATLSSDGTRDPDGDALSYRWTVRSADGAARTFTEPGPVVPFERNGVYTVTLAVTDAAKATAEASLDIVAGNAPPALTLDVKSANRTFFTPRVPVPYSVGVADPEDTAGGKGAPVGDRVAFSVDYVPEGFDLSRLAHGQQPADPSTRFAAAKAFVAASDCSNCHSPAAKGRGPSIADLAGRYKPDAATLAYLARKIRGGSAGAWGQEVMPAHPLISTHEAQAIAEYWLSGKDTRFSTLPLEGQFTPTVPEGDSGKGSLVFRAVYTDRGAAGLPARTAERLVVLRGPALGPQRADVQHRIAPAPARGSSGAVLPRANGHLGFKGIDLTGVTAIEITAQVTARSGHAGGTVEVRTGGPDGPLLGQRAYGPGSGGRGAPPTATEIQAAGGKPSAGQSGGRGNAPAAPIIAIPPTTGVHDLYIVFKNDAAKEAPLMSVSAIRVNFR